MNVQDLFERIKLDRLELKFNGSSTEIISQLKTSGIPFPVTEREIRELYVYCVVDQIKLHNSKIPERTIASVFLMLTQYDILIQEARRWKFDTKISEAMKKRFMKQYRYWEHKLTAMGTSLKREKQDVAISFTQMEDAEERRWQTTSPEILRRNSFYYEARSFLENIRSDYFSLGMFIDDEFYKELENDY